MLRRAPTFAGYAAAFAAALGACDASPLALDAGTDLGSFDWDVPVSRTDAATEMSGDAAEAVPAIPFRVWAPAADSVRIDGDFGTFPLASDGAGTFAAMVPAVAGQHYRFVLQSGGRMLVRTDPRARQLLGNDAVVPRTAPYPWSTPRFTRPRRSELVVYELHVGSFAVAAGDRNGTFAGVSARLDALADLGINAVELMPVTEFGAGATWGYGPLHWFAVNAAYGSPDDLRALVDAAHARGIAVFLDVVLNHASGRNTAPLYCFDGACPGGSYGPYFFPDPPYRATPWGPRPNYGNAVVAGILEDSIAMWLDEYRVDGFRWDSVSNIRGLDGMGTVPGGRELLVRANAIAHESAHNAFAIAEDLKGWDAITRPASDNGGFGFDAQWDGFVYTLGNVLVPASDDGRDLGALRGAITGTYNGDGLQRVLATENHDTVGNGSARIPQRIDGANPGSFAARKRSMLGAALMLTSPGIPMLFMGQEHLEAGTFAPTPAPLDWSREDAFSRVRAFYRAMVRLRRNADGVSAGLTGGHVEIIHFHDANKVIAYRRWNAGGDDVVVIANLRNRAYARYDVGLPAGGTWHVRMDTDDPQWSADFAGRAPATVEAMTAPRDNQPFTGAVVLGPWSVVVLSR